MAKEYNTRLNVFWRVDQCMNARFSQLFEIPNTIRLFESEPESLVSRALFSRHNPLAFQPEDRERYVAKCVERRCRGILPLTDFADYYSNPDYSWCKPLKYLQDRIDGIRDSMGESVIGVHIRRTDNEMAIKYSPLSVFVDRMKVAVDENEEQHFFVATDDEPTKSRLRSIFGNRIHTRENVAAREAETGVQDAVIDLFLLASCSHLFGSYYSSFSEVAAQIGRIGFEQLKKDVVS